MFVLNCPRCGGIVYDPVKRLCPEVPEENRSDIYCEGCGWIGHPDSLVKKELDLEMDDEGEEGDEDEDDSAFEWDVEK